MLVTEVLRRKIKARDDRECLENQLKFQRRRKGLTQEEPSGSRPKESVGMSHSVFISMHSKSAAGRGNLAGVQRSYEGQGPACQRKSNGQREGGRIVVEGQAGKERGWGLPLLSEGHSKDFPKEESHWRVLDREGHNLTIVLHPFKAHPGCHVKTD